MGNWVYFSTVSSPNDPDGIYRVDINGENEELLFEGTCTGLFVTEETIYFRFFQQGGIYKMNLDGSHVELAYDVDGDYFQIKDHLLYYSSREDRKLYCFDLRNNTSQKVTDLGVITQFYVYHDSVYYLDDPVAVSKIDLKQGTAKAIPTEFKGMIPEQTFNVVNEHTICYRANGAIYFLDLRTDTQRRITKAEVNGMYVTNDKLFFYDSDQQLWYYDLTSGKKDLF